MPDSFEKQTLHEWSALCRVPEDEVRTPRTNEDILADMEIAGLTVSFMRGPCGDRGVCWSVQVMHIDSCGGAEEFERPFAALSFDHALRIAEFESRKRGWL